MSKKTTSIKCIFAIRRALGEKPGEQKYIETVRKHGYRFVAEVRRIETETELIDDENGIHSESKQFPIQKSPRRVEPSEMKNRGTVIALADWRREADEIEAIKPKSFSPFSADSITTSESASTAPAGKSPEIETEPINLPKITKRRKGLIRGFKFLLCGLIVGFVFLILMRVMIIFNVLLLNGENALLLRTSKQLAKLIVELLIMLQIPIGLGLFFGTGLFLFGIIRMIYALFETETSKIKPKLIERIIAAIVVIIILSIAIPNLIFSYRQANIARQSQKKPAGDNETPLVFQSIQASRLTDNGNALNSEISPDGRFVAFITRDSGMESLVVRQVITSNGVPIVESAPVIRPVVTDKVVVIVESAPVNYYAPRFTPDGNFIYYVQVEKGIGTLFQIPTLGGESKKIIVDVDSKVTFSPDGKRLAFIRHNPNEGGDTIVIANNDGTSPESFLQTNEVNYDQFIGVGWSPENDKLLVGVFKNKGEINQKIRIVTIGLNDKKLEFVGDQGWLTLRNFEWMQNGAGIVLIGKTNSGENSQVWHLSYPIGERRQITTDTSNYDSASVSADGSSIVATRVDAMSSLWSRVPQTGEMHQLTTENANMLGYAGISQMPDGKILFVKATGKKINIYSVEETGAGEKQLTSGDGINQNPIATPDGKYIVFNSNRIGNFAIWRISSDGKDAVQLTDAQTMIDSNPQITKDGRSLVFMRQTGDGGKAKLMKVSIDGGETLPLIPENTMTELIPRISADGKLLAYLTYEFDANNPIIDQKVRILGLDGDKIDKNPKEFEFSSYGEFKFAPDNKSLTFVKKGGIDNLWSLSLIDRTEKPLTDFTTGNISNFAWSNDGKKLFIVRVIFTSDLVLIKDAAKTEE